jgi:hypothetical protein
MSLGLLFLLWLRELRIAVVRSGNLVADAEASSETQKGHIRR